MTESIISRIMAAIFIVLFVVYIVIEVGNKPRVMILHSYDTDYGWVRNVDRGIKDIIGKKPYTLRWHYMDTKRHSDEEFMDRAARSAVRAIDQWKPHVLIAVADNAQKLVVKKHYMNDPDMAVVFTGVVAAPSSYGYDVSTNVTGIRELWPMAVIRDGILSLLSTTKKFDSSSTIEEKSFEPADQVKPEYRPGEKQIARMQKLRTGCMKHGRTDLAPMVRRNAQAPSNRAPIQVTHLCDCSTTGGLIALEIQDFDWGPGLEVRSILVANQREWNKALAEVNSSTDVALFSLYHTLYPDDALPREGEDKPDSVSTCKIMQSTQKMLKIPSLGGWGFYAEQGGMMAIGVSPKELGEVAAKQTVEIIEQGLVPRSLGANPISIRVPITQSKQYLIQLRPRKLEQYEVNVPSIWEAFARATGKYYEKPVAPCN